jgi:3-phenylpropionate/trans-cinnamate dioxygenase ferredoxin subunit
MSSLQWHRIAGSENEIVFASNNIAVVEVANKKICITRVDGQWHGFAYKCPHASGIMANGNLDSDGNIICPVHRYRFSLKNGRNTSGEGYFLKTYPIEWREGALFVGLAQTGLFGW